MTEESCFQSSIESATDQQLFSIWVRTMAELRRRNILRSDNTPTGDYAEWLVSKALGLELAGNAKAGYDALNIEGVRFQIKARRLASKKTSRRLSALRNLSQQPFDYLIVVLFGPDFQVLECWQIPIEVVQEYAVFSQHVNAHLLNAAGAILLDERVTRLLAIEEMFSWN